MKVKCIDCLNCDVDLQCCRKGHWSGIDADDLEREIECGDYRDAVDLLYKQELLDEIRTNTNVDRKPFGKS